MEKNPILAALKFYGVTEIAGSENNKTIMKFFADIGQSWVPNDETAWCAAFLNAVLQSCGLPHSGSLAARSFLELGESTKEPQQGDLVVLWRVAKDSPYGHCGLFITGNDQWVYILGGNQANQVNISKFPAYQVLDYRRLTIEA